MAFYQGLEYDRPEGEPVTSLSDNRDHGDIRTSRPIFFDFYDRLRKQTRHACDLEWNSLILVAILFNAARGGEARPPVQRQVIGSASGES